MITGSPRDLVWTNVRSWPFRASLIASFLFALAVEASSQIQPKSDVTGNGRVDADDLLSLMREWHTDVGAPTSEAERLFYYVNGGQYPLFPSETEIGVAFSSDTSVGERNAFVSQHSDLAGFIDPASWPGPLRVSLSRQIEWAELSPLFDLWAQDDRTAYVTPVFPSGLVSDNLLTDIFAAKFLPDVTDGQIDALNAEHFVTIIKSGRLPHRHGWYIMKPEPPAHLFTSGAIKHHPKNALTALLTANLYEENPLLEYASPNFLVTDALQKPSTSGPDVGEQSEPAPPIMRELQPADKHQVPTP